MRHLSKSGAKAPNRVNGALRLRANYSLGSLNSSLVAPQDWGQPRLPSQVTDTGGVSTGTHTSFCKFNGGMFCHVHHYGYVWLNTWRVTERDAVTA